ncbi:MAG: hypothetical protein SGBAC_003829 [Bacillariaceae sp.]
MPTSSTMRHRKIVGWHLALIGGVLMVLVSLPAANGFVTPSNPLCHRWPIAASKQTTDDGYDGLGEYDPSEGIKPEREVVVGDPQLRLKEKERDVTSILRELAAIQQQGPQNAYALVLSGNHVYTSGAGGTNAATIRGALRAEREDLLTVVLPQSMDRQTKESQELVKKVKEVVTMPQNDEMSLDVASRICNSYLLSQTDQLISFAFHESSTVIEAAKEAKELDMLVTTLFLD